jgi:iron complex outermembrane recepter protein
LKISTMRERLLASSMICGAAFAALAAVPAQAQESEVSEVVVTGSRIVRQDYVANSPIATVTGEATVANADITLDTYLNTLPQVNPAASSTSNNPSLGGRSVVDLRGLGSNRNLVLIDGRRPMVSDNQLRVDLNTIPQAMIENVEVITGGAGATYGADAIAGVVNMRLKRNFEGVDLRASYSNSTEHWDAEEYQLQGVIGGNFADGKGNAIFGFDRSYRQPVGKNQRAFSQTATSTTGVPPEGAIRWTAANPIPEAAVDALFAGYGVAADRVIAQSGLLGFNPDGTLIFYGIPFNNQYNIQNFRAGLDSPNINQRFAPDFYSYNFDFTNLLVLPVDRYSYMTSVRYEMDNGVEFFAQAGWTEYSAAQALATTPIPSVQTAAPGFNTNLQASSALVTPGQVVSGNIVVPYNNIFIPNDFRTLLAARTGDNPQLVGSGNTEAWLYGFRPLSFGLRQSNFENTVVQYLAGVKAPLGDTGWRIEAYASEGRTEIDIRQTGNIDTQRLQDVLAAQVPGSTTNTSPCAQQNFFGDVPISTACVNYLATAVNQSQEFIQQIGQAYVAGDVFELPAGPLSTVFGIEYRGFEYSSRYLSNPGPFSGFNVGNPEGGTNSFKDFFAEALIPIVKDMPYFQTLEVGLGYRRSTSEFTNKITGISSGKRDSDAYKIDINWRPLDYARVRASYQRSVRAPNFGELFAGNVAFPQIFDPCSATSAARNGPNKTQIEALCVATGVPQANLPTFTATPGAQAQITVAGNTDLAPEEADTFTLGVVFSSPWENQWLERFRASIDYYDIEITGPILTPDTNIGIAGCYNYFGTNPNYSASNPYCAGLVRTGGQIQRINLLNAPTSPAFPGQNGGTLSTNGLDFQFDWGFDLEWLGADPMWGRITSNLLLTHVMSFKQNETPGLPAVEYAGTISYFGAGLGSSFPEWKATWTTMWDVGPVNVNLRARYIGSMENRAARQFQGESFQGVPAVTYWDIAGTYKMTDNVELRLGVNNIGDKQPPTYSPNVQSGTDPSTYDVIGRRVFGQINLRF